MKIAIIYMAAGNSRRFGSNKLFFSLDGKPLYLHTLERLASIAKTHTDWQVLTVTRYTEIMETVSQLEENGFPVKGIWCEDSTDGISHTIRAGIQAAWEADAWAFFVADQPGLTRNSAEGFLTYMKEGNYELGSVSCAGTPGNPTWFSSAFRDELLALTGDQGGRRILRTHADECTFYEIADPQELYDLDLPQDAGQ